MTEWLMDDVLGLPHHPGYGHQGAAPGCVSQPHLIPLGPAGLRGSLIGQGPTQQDRSCYPPFKSAPPSCPGAEDSCPALSPSGQVEGMRRQERGLEASARSHGRAVGEPG